MNNTTCPYCGKSFGIPTAKELRERISQVIQDKSRVEIQHQLDIIQQLLQNRIENPYPIVSCIEVEMPLLAIVANYLKSLGYEVSDIGNDGEKPKYRISW
jgi:hypothetical protein